MSREAVTNEDLVALVESLSPQELLRLRNACNELLQAMAGSPRKPRARRTKAAQVVDPRTGKVLPGKFRVHTPDLATVDRSGQA